VAQTAKKSYELSEAEQRDLVTLIQQGKALPEKYRFILFEDKREVELVWNGKNRDVCTTVLPFQTLEHVDEPRAETRAQGDLFDSRGRQMHGWTNKLIWGDNKLILSSLKAGALRQQIEDAGGLKLIYIDPPFDVGADFSMDIEIGGETFHKEPNLLEQIAYRDTWGHGADSFISMIYERLVLMRDLMNDEATIYVHCDWRVNSYIRLALDEVFGPSKFINEIVWQRGNPRVNSSRHLSHHTDTILMFSKSENYELNIQYTDLSKDYYDKYYNKVDERTGKRFMPSPLIGHVGTNKEYVWRGFTRAWRYPQHRLDELDAKGMIYWPEGGDGVPRFKKFIDESSGRAVQSLWTDISSVNSQAKEDTQYPTQKPEALLERIIRTNCNEGDLVADFFCGSGTTAAVAEKLGRKWIASDLGKFGIHTTRKRLIGVQRELKDGGKDFRAFEVLNLGRYERQAYLNIGGRLTSSQKAQVIAQKEREFRDLILRAYKT
jgi:site-specific DNA-methyltransferase (adenine-specific)/adenine-specific DNA-methyltransferase